MARPIEVTVDPELRRRLGAGADLAGGSRMLAARIAARKRRHATVVALVAAGEPGHFYRLPFFITRG